MARFENCSFREVKLKDWHCVAAEFVDCVFSGTMSTIVFNGSPRAPYTEFLARTTNEFRGNDFSGARFEDVGFRSGIDLSQQKLPFQDNLLVVWHGSAAMARVEGSINVWDDLENRKKAQGLLRFLRGLLEGGQEQLLLEMDDLRRVFGPAVWRRVEPALVGPERAHGSSRTPRENETTPPTPQAGP